MLWETKEMRKQRNAQTVTGRGEYSKTGGYGLLSKRVAQYPPPDRT